MLVSRSPVGRSKYSHHIVNTTRSAPTTMPTRFASIAPVSIAAVIATVPERTDSPSTMIVNSPYRSAMCSECQGRRAARAAQIGMRELGEDEGTEPQKAGLRFHRDDEQEHPADLRDADADDPPDRVRAMRRVRPGGSCPKRDRREAHDDVTQGHERPVALGEGIRDAGRDRDGPRHLHEDRQSIRDVVGVVGGREPGEAHPRPPDREERHRVREDRLGDVVVRDPVVEGRRGSRDGDDDDEVEEELERGRRPVGLVCVPSAHRDHGRYRPHGARR